MAGRLVNAHRRFMTVGMKGQLVAVMLGLGVLITGCSGGADSTATATNTPVETVVLVPATPDTRIQDATLGGTEAGFTNAYGAPTLNSAAVRHYNANIGGTPLVIVALLSDNKHVHHLRLIPQDSAIKWSAATASGIAQAFLPKDAKHSKDVMVSGSGLEHHYLSAALAGTFSADQFTDINTGAAVTPGTFYFVCGGDLDTDSGGCEFELGQ